MLVSSHSLVFQPHCLFVLLHWMPLPITLPLAPQMYPEELTGGHQTHVSSHLWHCYCCYCVIESGSCRNCWGAWCYLWSHWRAEGLSAGAGLKAVYLTKVHKLFNCWRKYCYTDKGMQVSGEEGNHWVHIKVFRESLGREKCNLEDPGERVLP